MRKKSVIIKKEQFKVRHFDVFLINFHYKYYICQEIRVQISDQSNYFFFRVIADYNFF